MKTHIQTAIENIRGGISIFTSRKGYTIVEVMIFLAVTGLLFAMMMVAFSGRQGRAQFSTASREMEAIVRDVINDVSTGYYPRTADFSCTPSLTGPQISTVINRDQGTNSGCIYVGRVLHFDMDGEADGRYNVYTLAGLRKDATTDQEVTSYDQAKPKVVQPITEQLTTPSGMIIRRMYYDPPAAASPDVELDGFAIVSTLGSYDSNGNLQAAALNTIAVPIGSSNVGGAPGSTEGEMISMLDSLNSTYVAFASAVTTEGKIIVCMDSQSSDQHAVLTIGGSQNSQLATDLVIGEGNCS